MARRARSLANVLNPHNKVTILCMFTLLHVRSSLYYNVVKIITAELEALEAKHELISEVSSKQVNCWGGGNERHQWC